MRSLFSLAKDSYASHFADGKDLMRSLLIRKIPINLAIALIYIGVVKFISKDVLNAIITLFSILIGFSYSVMIFLSANPRGAAMDSSDREGKLRLERFSSISVSLHTNLHFFCILSITLVLISLIGIATQSSSINMNNITYFVKYGSLASIVNLFYILLLTETCGEFFRILKRTNYLFSERIKGQ